MSEFLGKGVKFPFRFNENTGGVIVSSGEFPEHEHIKESIMQILYTSPGERFMLPEFGSRLRELVFQQNAVAFKALARRYIIDAIKRWEKRINVVDVQFEDSSEKTDRNEIFINVKFMVIENQVEGNLVFPFAREV